MKSTLAGGVIGIIASTFHGREAKDGMMKHARENIFALFSVRAARHLTLHAALADTLRHGVYHRIS